MTEKTPEQLRWEIDRTRAELSDAVDTLTEKVDPRRVVERRIERTRNAMTKAKDKIMGSNDGVLSSAATTVADTARTVADAAGSVPAATRRQAQGSPIAAALIAFGAGWLVSSVLPASKPERKLAGEAKDKALDFAQPLVQQAKQAGAELAGQLREPAQHAVAHVRSSAQDAASTVTEQAKRSVDQLQESQG